MKAFEQIQLGDEFLVPQYGDDPFAWCFNFEDWGSGVSPVLVKAKVVAQTDGFFSRNVYSFDSTLHGPMVHVADEMGACQWVPYKYMGQIVAQGADPDQLTFDSLWS